MLRVRNTVLIMLSTILGPDNGYTKILEKATGEFSSLFLKCIVDLMCDECKRLRKKPSECNHNDHRSPAWLSAANKLRAKFFMASEAMYAREVLGANQSDLDCVFHPDWLQRLKTKIRATIPASRSNIIYTYIDPSGGGEGEQSETAIASVLRLTNGEIIIIGMASFDTQNEQDINDLTLGYFKRFKDAPYLSDLQHILIVEKNFGGKPFANIYVNRAKYVLRNLEEYTPSYHKTKGKKGSGSSSSSMSATDGSDGSGATLYRELKIRAVQSMIANLCENKISFADEILTILPVNPMDKEKEEKKMVEKVLGQFANLRKVYKGGKWTYSAKRPKMPDDLITCVYMAAELGYEATMIEHMRYILISFTCLFVLVVNFFTNNVFH